MMSNIDWINHIPERQNREEMIKNLSKKSKPKGVFPL